MDAQRKKKIKKKIKIVIFNPVVQWVAAILAVAFIWFIYFTCRKKYNNYQVFKKYRKSPSVFVFWHGRTLLLPAVTRIGGIRAYIVASSNRDGRIMANIQKLFGLRVIYGSSTRGGVNVLMQGLRILRGGRYCVGLSPDGPSGPSMRFHDGALYFAKMAGVPIVPVCISASRAWIFKTWDCFMVPKPFSTITVDLLNPVFINRNADASEFERVRKDLEDMMVAQVRRIDDEFNLPPVPQNLTSTDVRRARREERAAKKAAKKGNKK